MKLDNANAIGEVFYGLHMTEGVAEYKAIKDSQGDPLRIFVGEQAIKNMDSTFPGRPVFVQHVNEVDHSTVRQKADGWVTDSFYNKADGKHWCKMLLISDEAKQCVRQGWKVSNSYHMKTVSGGGKWHGVDYAKEVLQGEYEHLALVPNPRYEESLVLTPEEFKAYNLEKENHLVKIANADDPKKPKEKKGMFEFFKRTKVDNSADLEGMSVTLPKSKKEISLETMIKNADEMQLSIGKPRMANQDDLVVLGDDQMSVKDLTEKFLQMQAAGSAATTANNSETEPKKDEKKADNSETPPKDDKKLENEESDEDKKKREAEEAKAKKAENSLGNFTALKNAADAAKINIEKYDSREDQVARGQARYGSK